jgi:hypothetical protein
VARVRFVLYISLRPGLHERQKRHVANARKVCDAFNEHSKIYVSVIFRTVNETDSYLIFYNLKDESSICEVVSRVTVNQEGL